MSWFSVLLLAFNVFASAALPARPISLTAGDAGTLLAQAMEYCSDHGETGQSPVGQLPSESGHGPSCVFCLPLMHGGLALPAAVAAVEKPVEPRGQFILAAEKQRFIPVRLPTPVSPRAPPLA